MFPSPKSALADNTTAVSDYIPLLDRSDQHLVGLLSEEFENCVALRAIEAVKGVVKNE